MGAASMPKIKTTGELRAFLAELLNDVKSGSISLDAAARITKLAGQINESFYSEIKVAAMRSEMNSEKMLVLGDMPIGCQGEE